jgi:excinuclease ABC subunit B
VFDADTQGFLRSATSLIQIIGRAARNPNGSVVLYADKITPAMRAAIDETDRRRTRQQAHNAANGIDPKPLHKQIVDLVGRTARAVTPVTDEPVTVTVAREIEALEQAMVQASKSLRFEEAALLRDEVGRLRRELSDLSEIG